MAGSQLFLIVVLAMVAAGILFRLYTVLGRRTGNERPPAEKWNLRGVPEPSSPPQGTPENVVTLPGRAAPAAADPLTQALTEIKLADRNFETEHFLLGAQKAYEMIVTAYAAGDRATLKPLLSAEVFAAFEAVMKSREERNEKVTFSFVGFKSVKFVHAELKGRMAEVTIEFAAQYVTSTADASGTVVEGDPKAMRDVVDHWTFARDPKSSDPNWILVATSSPA